MNNKEPRILKFETPDESKKNEAIGWTENVLKKSDKFLLFSQGAENLDIVHHGFTKYELIALIEIFKNELINGRYEPCE